ncbi:MAG: type transport system permease protein [Chloroflexota bacterium]|jgi:ABC-2 type transport system permease protein|nr:type transport system permease protein [Chloroflexota bacterium]
MGPDQPVASVVRIATPLRLEISRTIRAPRFLFFAVGLPLAVYIAYSLTGIGSSTGAAPDGLSWRVWLMVSMAAFGAMSATTLIAAGPSSIHAHGQRTGARGNARAGAAASASAKARLVTAMVLALPPLVLLGVAGAVAGVRLPPAEWVALIVLLWLGAVPFAVLGLLLGPVLDADAADVVLPGILVVLAVLGGLFQPVETFPSTLAAIARVVPSYHLADLGWTAIAGRTVDPVDVLVLAGYALLIGALVLWRTWSEDRQVGV